MIVGQTDSGLLIAEEDRPARNITPQMAKAREIINEALEIMAQRIEDNFEQKTIGCLPPFTLNQIGKELDGFYNEEDCHSGRAASLVQRIRGFLGGKK